MAGLVRRIVLCAMLIFFTDNMLSAETVTLSTIMPASASGVKRVFSGAITDPSASNNTITFSSPLPVASKTVIQVSGGGTGYSIDNMQACTYFYWNASVLSVSVSGTNIASFTVTPKPALGNGYFVTGWNGTVVAYYTVIEYL
jgi:hypothetical protein